MQDNIFKQAAVHQDTTKNTLYITNMGPEDKRNDAINLLIKKKLVDESKEFRYYKKDPQTGFKVGAFLIDGSKVVFRNGRNTFKKENIAFKKLKERLQEIAQANKVIDITFIDPDGNEHPFEDIQASEVEAVGKQGKADFSIDKKVFISHKAGQTAKDFGQYGGTTQFKNMKDVKNFNEIIKVIFDYFGEIDEYPSAIDFQQAINEPDLVMHGVFGKDWKETDSGINNVDFVIQGDITLEPFNVNLDDAEDPKGNIEYHISGNKVFSKDYAKYNITKLDTVFPDGYMPVLNVRRGEKTRQNIPGISGSRTAIQSEKGREVNFRISKHSTPDNIEFDSITLPKRQITNVKKFEKYLKDEKGLQQVEGNLLDKLLSSISFVEE